MSNYVLAQQLKVDKNTFYNLKRSSHIDSHANIYVFLSESIVIWSLIMVNFVIFQFFLVG